MGQLRLECAFLRRWGPEFQGLQLLGRLCAWAQEIDEPRGHQEDRRILLLQLSRLESEKK